MANNVLGGDPTPEGATGPWCWIAENVHNSTMWMVITGKGWEIFCYLITATAVLFILTKLKLVRCFVCFLNIYSGLKGGAEFLLGGGGAKIVNEYDQEIPQSQTTDKPVAS